MAFRLQLLIHQYATSTIRKLLSHVVTKTTNVRLIVSLPTTYLLYKRNSNPSELGTWNAFRQSKLVALDVCDWLVNRNCDSRAGPESPWYLYKERTIIKYASGSCYAHNAMHQVQSALFNGVSWHSVHHKTTATCTSPTQVRGCYRSLRSVILDLHANQWVKAASRHKLKVSRALRCQLSSH